MRTLLAPPVGHQNLALKTGHEHQDPLMAVAAMDLTPFSAPIADIDPDLAATAAAVAGGRNPQEVTTRFDHWVLRAGGAATATAVAVPAGIALLPALYVLIACAVVGQTGMSVAGGIMSSLLLALFVAFTAASRKLAGVVPPSILRVHLAALVNQTIQISCGGQWTAWSLRETYAFLPLGDRNIWLQDQLRWQDTAGTALDHETGRYCYEVRHEREVTDREGNRRIEPYFTTSTINYLHVPLPHDILTSTWVPVRIHRGRFGPKLLSAAFDREFKVSWFGADTEARLQVVKQLAPDVQTAIIEGFSQKRFDLTVSSHGALLIGQPMPADRGGGASSPGYPATLAWLALVLHQMFEQINPAYKMPLARQRTLLKQLRLPAT